jgi:malonyl-ACP decarboxylase
LAAEPDLAVSGIGVAAAGQYGKEALQHLMFAPAAPLPKLARPGRVQADGAAVPGFELPEPPRILSPRVERTAGLSARIAVAVLAEAWMEANLDVLDPERIGLVVGGSNLFEREFLLARDDYAGRMGFWPPRFGCAFLDTDVAAVCASHYPIRGFCKTVGGASASGLIAVLEAADAVRSGRADACIALGAMQDISANTVAGFSALGVLGTKLAPFDRDSDGLVYGESAAALVVTRADRTSPPPYGLLAGWAHVADGTRGPEPSPAGQSRAVHSALRMANRAPEDIAYVNAHGTGTPAGDETELATLSAADLCHAALNASKSLFGHGLSAAGAVELAVVLMQMRLGMLHACHHLANPRDPGFNWVMNPQPLSLRDRQAALKTSFGFGGTNAAVIVVPPPGDRI